MALLGIFIEVIIRSGEKDTELAELKHKLIKLLQVDEKKDKKPKQLRNVRELWHRNIRVVKESEKLEKPLRLSEPQKPDEESDIETISTDVERTKQHIPGIKKRIFNQVYQEMLRSAPIAEDGDIITKLYQCKRMLEAFDNIKQPIDDEFRKLLSYAKLIADFDVREWYENAVKEYGNYMKPYLQVMLYLLRCQIKKHRILLEEYALERWKVVTDEEHQKLFDSMRELEDKMKKDRRISSYVWRNDNQKKFTCDSEMYYIKSLEEFNKMQKNKLKISERVMTLFEIEHTQQIVDHTRNEFQRLEQMEAENYGEVLKDYLRLQKHAKKVKDEIKKKNDKNCNLHYRMITLRRMFTHLLDQLFKLFNYYLDEKNCTNITKLPMFDLQLFSEILGEKPRECMQNKRGFCRKNLLDLILIPQKDECDKKETLQITDDVDFRRIIDHDSDHASTAEEVIDTILEDVIPSPPSNPPLISFSEESDYLEIVKDHETLVEEAIEDQREEEIYYRLVGDELNILRDIEPEEFIKQRLEIIFDTIRKNKELIAPIFERF